MGSSQISQFVYCINLLYFYMYIMDSMIESEGREELDKLIDRVNEVLVDILGWKIFVDENMQLW